MKYKKKALAQRPAAITDTMVLGMLYIVSVRYFNRATREKTKQKVLVVGSEAADIERKVRWIFDGSNYDEFSITDIEKVREKVHVLSTVITQDAPKPEASIDRGGRSQSVPLPPTQIEEMKLFAVGVTTTMPARDELHALRKVANAILASATPGQSHSGARLSADSTVQIEEIHRSSGYAAPRDVSNETNRAHFVRG